MDQLALTARALPVIMREDGLGRIVSDMCFLVDGYVWQGHIAAWLAAILPATGVLYMTWRSFDHNDATVYALAVSVYFLFSVVDILHKAFDDYGARPNIWCNQNSGAPPPEAVWTTAFSVYVIAIWAARWRRYGESPPWMRAVLLLLFAVASPVLLVETGNASVWQTLAGLALGGAWSAVVFVAFVVFWLPDLHNGALDNGVCRMLNIQNSLLPRHA